MERKNVFILLVIIMGLISCEEPESFLLPMTPDAAIPVDGNIETIVVEDSINIEVETPVTPDPDPQGSIEVTPFGQDPSLYGNLVFADEFNGTTIDETKWTKHLWYTQEPSTNNYDVADGYLNMWPVLEGGSIVRREFSTEGKHYQTYGYFEMEAKLPRGAGVTPTFWLYNHDVPGLFPEIDIMEAWGWPRPSMGYWTAEDGTLNNYQGTVHNTSDSQQGLARLVPQITADLSSDFHVYGCRWDETGVEFFFDGQLIGQKIMTDNHFRRMFMMVWLQGNEYAVAGSGELSQSNFYTPEGKANSYSINYVRIWDIR